MLSFLKMHGCGNDFVVFDAREKALPALNWKKIADRHFGIGCDQVVILEKSSKADVFMRIYNADGSQVASCGNASRCVGWLMGKKTATIETLAGIIEAQVEGETVTIDMGAPRLEWNEIPLAKLCDTLHVPAEEGPLRDAVAVSMGNPHVVFFVDDANAIALEKIGPVLEHHPLFPERVNVNVAQVVAKNKIRLRVWERGAGLTLACGTGACATLVAAHRRGLAERKAEIELPGGTLAIEWREETNHVLMTGPVAMSFKGELNPESYAL